MQKCIVAIAVSVSMFQAVFGSVFEKTPSVHTGKAIQEAIDAVHNAGGGNVKLERAVYPSGTLYLKSKLQGRDPWKNENLLTLLFYF